MVEDDEFLHRSVRQEWAVLVDGELRLSSQAFNDPSLKPSVDRARMRPAVESKRSPTDGICCLLTSEVRSITTVMHQALMRPYEVDVKARPIEPDNERGEPANPAHAQIEVEPEFESRSRFNKLKDALCRLASARGWTLQPGE